jgi:hypothetical protein
MPVQVIFQAETASCRSCQEVFDGPHSVELHPLATAWLHEICASCVCAPLLLLGLLLLSHHAPLVDAEWDHLSALDAGPSRLPSHPLLCAWLIQGCADVLRWAGWRHGLAALTHTV